MNKLSALAALIVLLSISATVRADVFNLGLGLTNLEMVTVGDLGNAADTRYATPGYGSVSYTYSIGKYEVTAAQYCDFLNHKAKSDSYGLYSSNMSGVNGCHIERSGSSGSYSYSVSSDWANRPVVQVSYWDACRFTNWLSNGQVNGDTETGAYTLNGYTGEDGRTIQRNAGASWFLPSEDEWYKAAYYKSGGTNAGYWDYPTQSNSAPSNAILNPDPGNSANYYTVSGWSDSTHLLTNVGEFENSGSAYGTFDQGGNVQEWNEASEGTTRAYRGVRGGMCSYYANALSASYRNHENPTTQGFPLGFRVAAAVPEPSPALALSGGLALLAIARRRRR